MYLRSLLDSHIKLSPSYFAFLHQFSDAYFPPVSAHKSRITGLRGRRMIEQLLDRSLCEGRMSLGAWRVSKVLCEARAVVDCLSKGGGGTRVSRWSFNGWRGWSWHFRSWRNYCLEMWLSRRISRVEERLCIFVMHAIAGREGGMYEVVFWGKNRRLLLKARDPVASCGVVSVPRDLENNQPLSFLNKAWTPDIMRILVITIDRFSLCRRKLHKLSRSKGEICTSKPSKEDGIVLPCFVQSHCFPFKDTIWILIAAFIGEDSVALGKPNVPKTCTRSTWNFQAYVLKSGSKFKTDLKEVRNSRNSV